MYKFALLLTNLGWCVIVAAWAFFSSMQHITRIITDIFLLQWVQEGSPSHSTNVKIESPHQFVPKSGDPNEFKRKQKQVSKFERILPMQSSDLSNF